MIKCPWREKRAEVEREETWLTNWQKQTIFCTVLRLVCLRPALGALELWMPSLKFLSSLSGSKTGLGLWRIQLCFCLLGTWPPLRHGVNQKHREPLGLTSLGCSLSPWRSSRITTTDCCGTWFIISHSGLPMDVFVDVGYPWSIPTLMLEPHMFLQPRVPTMLLHSIVLKGGGVVSGIIPLCLHTSAMARPHPSLVCPQTAVSPSTEGFLRGLLANTIKVLPLMSSLVSTSGDIMISSPS